MTNEEKALEIKHNDPCCVWNAGCPNVYYAALEMAKWKDEHPKEAWLDKACEFLKSYRQETPDGMGYIAGIVNDETIKDFRKYMEE